MRLQICIRYRIEQFDDTEADTNRKRHADVEPAKTVSGDDESANVEPAKTESGKTGPARQGRQCLTSQDQIPETELGKEDPASQGRQCRPEKADPAR